MTWLISALLVALALLVIEDCSRRSWKRSFKRERTWNREHFTGTGDSPYDLERAFDTRKARL